MCVWEKKTPAIIHIYFAQRKLLILFFFLTVVNYFGEGNFTYDISGAGAEML